MYEFSFIISIIWNIYIPLKIPHFSYFFYNNKFFSIMILSISFGNCYNKDTL